MVRRTKIVATLGPATDDPKVLDKLIDAGVDVVRINFSHGKPEQHKERAERVRNRARAHGRQVGILADLQGPKIRIELLDDGRIVLWVEEVEGHRIVCKVVVGGVLSDRKGINLKGGGLSAPALTDKDRKDIKLAAELRADYLAVSFPRSASDINEARELLRAAGGHGELIAKIERAEALDCIEEIIEASDAIMVARGDLGVEIGDAALPPVQKKLIYMAREMNKVVITATQMMESMIENHMMR